ncbi:MAG TPA: phosphate signaling complex protein PhoU [Bacteroidales bacterium]|nr:phosphate signaling complex protein PhoU [Bacteroidales bacterium]HPT04056.1 phosphate signaling complex protein PhoU [Bacteroidales bacterium]
MERHFDQELEKLNNRILKMGKLVESQITDTMQALLNCDVELAGRIIENDNQVDVLDVKIDKLCQRIFALSQPVASDLRLIMAALKINNDLERLGDLGVTIAKKIEAISEFKDVIVELNIDTLANMSEILVKDCINILTTRNVTFIRDIFESAATLKDKVQQTSNRIIDEMMNKTDVVVVATNLMLIISQMERIAGYSTNIAESVYFLVEGKIVKHTKYFELT